MSSNFTWIDFYSELADKLLEYRDVRPALIEKIYAAYTSVNMSVPTLESTEKPTDIDPFTVFGLFNKGITETNRLKIIDALGNEFGVSAERPADFDGVPVLNNLNATFYAFEDNAHRGKDDIDHLWDVFCASLALAENNSPANREAFALAFDAAAGQHGLGWKLTMGLFWIRPLFFINLDSRNRWYLGNIGAAGQAIANVMPKQNANPTRNGEEYLKICGVARQQLDTPECPQKTLPELSHAAFVESERVNNEKASTDDKKVLKNKYVPLIQALAALLKEHNGELSVGDAHQLMQTEKGFGNEELNRGSALGWARNYLAEAGYIDRSAEAKKQRIWRLTEAGWDADLTDEEVSRIIRIKNAKKPEQDGLDDDVATQRYWLYAPGSGAHLWEDLQKRKQMTIGWEEIGDLSEYETKDEMKEAMRELIDPTLSFKNAAHATWQFTNEMQVGDIVYVKKGMYEIIGRGVVKSDYYFMADQGEDLCNIRDIEWTHSGSWKYPGQAPVKTLTDITPYTQICSHLKSLFESEGDKEELSIEEIAYPTYTKEDFLSDVFMEEESYDTLVDLLRIKKNVILQGAPGVGKTYAAKRLAYSIMGEKDISRVMMVQFHQSYSYEDFIEGYRPSADKFDLVKGAFYEFCKKAEEDEGSDYFFIIDEINRGNLSKIFGELFMLIESDKRGPKNTLQLLYSRELFHVPSNVHLIGMMNTADRSLAMLDYALRRRFAFVDLTPGFSTEGFATYRRKVDSPEFSSLISCVERLNEVIAEDDALGEGFCIGHSYFCGLRPDEAIDTRLTTIVEYELIPLLKEYWFDEPTKVKEWSNSLRKAIK